MGIYGSVFCNLRDIFMFFSTLGGSHEKRISSEKLLIITIFMFPCYPQSVSRKVIYLLWFLKESNVTYGTSKERPFFEIYLFSKNLSLIYLSKNYCYANFVSLGPKFSKNICITNLGKFPWVLWHFISVTYWTVTLLSQYLPLFSY